MTFIYFLYILICWFLYTQCLYFEEHENAFFKSFISVSLNISVVNSLVNFLLVVFKISRGKAVLYT